MLNYVLFVGYFSHVEDQLYTSKWPDYKGSLRSWL